RLRPVRDAAGSRGGARITESVEPEDLEPRGVEVDGDSRGGERPAKFTCEIDAVGARAGGVRGRGGEARAGGQRPEGVAGVHEPGAHEQSDLGRVAHAVERDGAGPPLVGTTALPGEPGGPQG